MKERVRALYLFVRPAQFNVLDTSRTEMVDKNLAFKARLVLARRSRRVNVGSYLRENWRRHVLVAVCSGILFFASCLIGNYYIAIVIATLWAGRFVRDIQWYRALSREWESTKELLDWEKIERIANRDDSQSAI